MRRVAEQDTRRWQKLSRLKSQAGDHAIHALRGAIAKVRAAPHDIEARRELRALATDQASREQLVMLLVDEVGVDRPRAVTAAFYEELADVHENLDQPLETIAAMEAVCSLQPTDADQLDRLAWLYRRAGASGKAADAFERLAAILSDDAHRARDALHAAATLYRETARLDRAVERLPRHPRELPPRSRGDHRARRAVRPARPLPRARGAARRARIAQLGADRQGGAAARPGARARAGRRHPRGG